MADIASSASTPRRPSRPVSAQPRAAAPRPQSARAAHHYHGRTLRPTTPVAPRSAGPLRRAVRQQPLNEDEATHDPALVAAAEAIDMAAVERRLEILEASLTRRHSTSDTSPIRSRSPERTTSVAAPAEEECTRHGDARQRKPDDGGEATARTDDPHQPAAHQPAAHQPSTNLRPPPHRPPHHRPPHPRRPQHRPPPSKAAARLLRDQMAAAALSRHANAVADGIALTLRYDPIVLDGLGRPVAVSTLLERYGADDPVQNAARAKAERAKRLQAAMERARASRLIREAVERAEAMEQAKAHAEARREAELRAATANAQRLAAHAAMAERIEEAAGRLTELRRQTDRADMHEVTWRRLRGAELDPLLRVDKSHGEAPVRLLDARFLVELTSMLLADGQTKLPRRQELPDAAFLPFEAVRRMTESGFGSTRILCVSWPWLHPLHPDPRADHLRTLARALEMFLRDRIFQTHHSTYAVFLDWCCIPQLPCTPDEHEGGAGGATSSQRTARRTEAEEELYTRAIEGMGDLFAHRCTVTLALTPLPTDYPHGFTFSEKAAIAGAAYLEQGARREANTAPYEGRGWCVFEHEVSALIKPTNYVLDLRAFAPGRFETLGEMLSALKLVRKPPQLPAAFEARLEQMSFADKGRDLPIVARLYAQTFEKRYAQGADELIYRGLRWGRAEMRLMNEIFASGVLSRVEKIDLSGNLFQKWDAEEIRAAIETGKAKGLGFDPERVLLGDQDLRPQPNMCTTLKVGFVERSTDFRLRQGMPSSMIFAEKR